jgi:hypothetical protein
MEKSRLVARRGWGSCLIVDCIRPDVDGGLVSFAVWLRSSCLCNAVGGRGRSNKLGFIYLTKDAAEPLFDRNTRYLLVIPKKSIDVLSRNACAGEQVSQPSVFPSYPSCCSLHQHRCLEFFAFVFAQSLPKILGQFLSASTRAPLVLADPSSRRNGTFLSAKRLHPPNTPTYLSRHLAGVFGRLASRQADVQRGDCR